MHFERNVAFSVVVPCYNESATLRDSVEGLLAIQDASLTLEVIIVNDASTDDSLDIARSLASEHEGILVLEHGRNMGKGAALKTGFQAATGEFVGVHDADLEYDPRDLVRLLGPLVDGRADVVYGSRYLRPGERRVLSFFHSFMNKGLTLVSNMFTDLDLTDMETCYKLFRREVLQGFELREDRFGFEPEITIQVAHARLRVYELPISYVGRTFEEGKKIGVRDGIRALYCLFHYGAYRAALPLQLLIYFFLGFAAALANIAAFGLLNTFMPVAPASILAFFLAAAINYLLCIAILFRHNARWSTPQELLVYFLCVSGVGLIDLVFTLALIRIGMSAMPSKILATAACFFINFTFRKYLVFWPVRKSMATCTEPHRKGI